MTARVFLQNFRHRHARATPHQRRVGDWAALRRCMSRGVGGFGAFPITQCGCSRTVGGQDHLPEPVVSGRFAVGRSDLGVNRKRLQSSGPRPGSDRRQDRAWICQCSRPHRQHSTTSGTARQIGGRFTSRADGLPPVRPVALFRGPCNEHSTGFCGQGMRVPPQGAGQGRSRLNTSEMRL